MKLPNIVKNSSLYTFAQLFQKCAGFFLMPLYTSFLTPADYGTMNIINSVIGFFGILYLLSLHGAASRFHYSKTGDEQKVLWGTILLLVLFNSVALGSICLIFHKWLVDPFTGDISFWKLTFFSLLSSMLSPVYMFYQQWLQIREDGIRYTINLMLNWFLTVVANIITIVCFRWGVFGMIISSFTVSIIFFVYSIFAFLPHIKLQFRKDIAKVSLKYSLPLVPSATSSYLSVMADRLILNKLVSLSAVGLYSIANQFGLIMNTITTSINQAYSPWFMRGVSRNQLDQNKMNIIMETSILLTSVLSFLIVMFSPEVIRLMASEAFHESWRAIIFLVFGFVMNGVYYYFSMPLFYYKPGWIFIISLCRLAANIILNIVLIPRWDFIGAGMAFFASVFVSTLVSLLLERRFSPHIRYKWHKAYIYTFLFLLLSAAVFIIEGSALSYIHTFLLKIAYTVVFVIIVFILYRKRIRFVAEHFFSRN